MWMTSARLIPMFAVLASLGAGTPVAAQSAPSNLFSVPEGCTAFLTVQSRSCIVSHMWRCEGDPEGSHWRVTLDQEGAFYLNFTDSEFRWLRAWNLRGASQDILIEPEDDPASLTTLLETGTDSMVFSIREESTQGTSQRDYTGFDRLTGETVVIDGELLEVTEFAYQWDTGSGARSTAGNQFVSRSMRLFFGGLETVTLPNGETAEGNFSPVEFFEPGEDGFLTTEPRHDCGDTMSALHLPPIPRG